MKDGTGFEERVEMHHRQLLEDGVTVIPAPSANAASHALEAAKAFIAANAALFDKHLDGDGHLPRIINMHVAFPRLLDMYVRNEVALAVQDRFFGAPSTVYTTLYYERGSAQPIHRDSPYFCTRPEGRYLGVWVAFEDADTANGCLEVVRGGHKVTEPDREAMAVARFGSLDKVPSSSQELWDDYQAAVTAACARAGLKNELVQVKAGDTVIWHPALPHGGSAIGDLRRTRHSLVLHVTPPGAAVYHQDVFFNRNRVVPETAQWSYAEHGGRRYARQPHVEFGHQDPTPPERFVQPA